MTVEEVAKRVAAIAEVAGDYEVAHGAEDALWSDVLQAIADGAADPKALATEALKINQILFERHCA